MRKDYVGLAAMLLRLAMAPDAMVRSSDIKCQGKAGQNAIKMITGTIVRSDDLLSLQKKEASALTCWRAQATSEPMRARR
jgi:hypothetical protein